MNKQQLKSKCLFRPALAQQQKKGQTHPISVSRTRKVSDYNPSPFCNGHYRRIPRPRGILAYCATLLPPCPCTRPRTLPTNRRAESPRQTVKTGGAGQSAATKGATEIWYKPLFMDWKFPVFCVALMTVMTVWGGVCVGEQKLCVCRCVSEGAPFRQTPTWQFWQLFWQKVPFEWEIICFIIQSKQGAHFDWCFLDLLNEWFAFWKTSR